MKTPIVEVGQAGDAEQKSALSPLGAGTSAPVNGDGWKWFTDQAIAVLQQHIVPDGLSDRDALLKLYDIFDGPEFRSMGTIPQVRCDERQAEAMQIDRLTANAFPTLPEAAAQEGDSAKERDEEILTLHRKLAAETLRADQGWQRYESANADRNALRAALATRPQPAAEPQFDIDSAARRIASVLTTTGVTSESGYYITIKAMLAGSKAAAPSEGAQVEKIAAARARLTEAWEAQGDCGSCGWHAALYEHDVSDEDLKDALENHGGWLHLECRSKDADDRECHRGVKVFIGTTPTAAADGAHAAANCDPRVCQICAKNYPDIVAAARAIAPLASSADTANVSGDLDYLLEYITQPKARAEARKKIAACLAEARQHGITRGQLELRDRIEAAIPTPAAAAPKAVELPVLTDEQIDALADEHGNGRSERGNFIFGRPYIYNFARAAVALAVTQEKK